MTLDNNKINERIKNEKIVTAILMLMINDFVSRIAQELGQDEESTFEIIATLTNIVGDKRKIIKGKRSLETDIKRWLLSYGIPQQEIDSALSKWGEAS
jgi:hypothetical protein